jgi:endoglucanase
MDNNIEWLKKISEVRGVSGFEGRVKDLLQARLSGVTEVSGDKLGSIIFKSEGQAKAPKIMLASHMDEIGFIVKNITKEGYLKFATLGGWWEHVMLGQRVMVMTAKGDIPGVIGSKPPHILPLEERKKVLQKKDMYIDIGAASEQEAKEFGVRPGDAIVPDSHFTVMANGKYLMSKAWDNRIGCAAMADVLLNLNKREHPNTVYGVGTVQEEVGLRGAKTSAGVIDPDLAIVIDTCIAGDTPGVTSDQSSSVLGKGVAICIFDASLIPHTKFRDYVIKLAEENNIPYQFEFSEGGGTDGGRIHIHSQGVPTIVLSITTRYLHSHNSIIDKTDYEAAVKLITLLLDKLDYAKYQELIS